MSKLRLICIAKQNVRSKERRKASIRKHQFIFIIIAHLWEQKIHENSGKNIIFSYLRRIYNLQNIYDEPFSENSYRLQVFKGCDYFQNNSSMTDVWQGTKYGRIWPSGDW